MLIENIKTTVENMSKKYKDQVSDDIKTLVTVQEGKLKEPDCSYSEMCHVGIIVSKLLMKRAYRNIKFDKTESPLMPKKRNWEKISAEEAVKKLEAKSDEEISPIFYDDFGKKHLYSTNTFDILFYDTDLFSDNWHDVAYILKKKNYEEKL